MIFWHEVKFQIIQQQILPQVKIQNNFFWQKYCALFWEDMNSRKITSKGISNE